MKKPRLTQEDRLRIEDGLRCHKKVYAIAKELNRPARTIMREIKGPRSRIQQGRGLSCIKPMHSQDGLQEDAHLCSLPL